jgi:methyltransferase (TIGR00027 family)
MDEVVLDAVAHGLDELVLLGAGLDSRPYRFAEQLQGVQVIEVDHPARQESKRARLSRLLDGEPDHVTFVGLDFNRDDLGAALAAAGHERTSRMLFIWAGVSPYLSDEAVAEVLSWVGGHESSGTSIVFDAVLKGVVDGSHEYFGAPQLRKTLAQAGVPLRWGMPEGEIAETLSRFGMRVVRELDDEEGRAAYLRRSDDTLHERPYGGMMLFHARAG